MVRPHHPTRAVQQSSILFEAQHQPPPQGIRTVLRILPTILLLSAVDLLAAPPLGSLRDHLLAWKEGALLPLLLVTHLTGATVLVALAVLRHPNQPDARKHILWGAVLSSPAISLAFVLDEFLYMQIRY